ncbi:MAG: glycogen/starch/alpha-glucan phosphorylase, partial [Phycisphaerae bacterium]|nr:glycogen/starch/alpha-glucan phosphorylase [Phycisphaerae bacterium]
MIFGRGKQSPSAPSAPSAASAPAATPARTGASAAPCIEVLTRQYGCGPVPLTSGENALYDRHLVFDNVIDPEASDARERYEAFARSIRDVLAQRWLKTIDTYRKQDAKRVYYLSMEFLIGRSLSNNVSNLLLTQVSHQAAARKHLDWEETINQEPDAGLGNGGLGRLAACFLDSMATMQIPAIGYGLRYEYGMFRQTIENGWQNEQADHWLQHPDPWEVVRPDEQVEVNLACSFEMRDGHLQPVPGKPSTLLGIPYDRPIVGFGGKNINTLRLWAASVRNEFDLHEFSTGDFVGALAHSLSAESLTRVLYPDDSTNRGRCLRFIQEYFLVACSLADIVRRFKREKNDWALLPQRAAIQLNDTHPSLAV